MIPDRFARLKELLLQAADLPPEKRRAWLAATCQDDPNLRREIEAILEHDGTREILRPGVLLREAPEGIWPGRVLGGRYRLEALLGRGGMGEVWKAFDLKICVEVALKRLHDAHAEERRRELLRREVRAAREVLSPHVCRIFDLVEIDDQELVSMEYVDGSNLSDLLREPGALSARQAGEIAGRILAGLQAIHDAGLVHRDLKPGNVMITRAGRVVVMDFGIAQSVTEYGRIPVAGTPAYMSPEQARGDRVDARADIYAAGIVLAELAYRESLVGSEARKALWHGIRNTPPQLPEGPWREVLLHALEADPARRYASAHEFSRALDQVLLQTESSDQRSPFPGLSAFTEADAQFFFGREFEVEALGKKLRRLHMLAVVGPSGVGKSSFLRAGMIPALPAETACLICTPGRSPFISLGQALAPHIAGDTDAMRAFLRFGEPDIAVPLFARWRRSHEDALVIVDQFEELFTQNAKEVQDRFATLLGRLPIEADVRVLLSLRDDFLFHCHAHEGLRPMLTELTLLPPLRGADLRRAVRQPALACGFRYEEDGLVDRMAVEVESERGALPLLAFAVARLWEHRDHERGVIPSAAYEAIGGVAGSLAQHAETVLERIGSERELIVREIFRNLVTARGTRVSREREELLSVFCDADTASGRADKGDGVESTDQRNAPATPSRQAAAEVLAALINARLLTSYETADPHDASVRRQRIEIVHESLLSHWPRLVRWQTQDEDSAQLRDQLGQAAQIWEQRGRPDELLWTGTMYREFRLWRERYPGSLTGPEEAFAASMKRRAWRRRRRRRVVAGSAFAVLLAVLGIVGGLWARSERAQKAAVAEARRSEAEKLYALARNEKNQPTALAYLRTALELSDEPEYRRSVLKILLRTPAPLQLPRLPDQHNPWAVDFSPDGKWLAIGWTLAGGLQLYSLDGGEPRCFLGHENWITSAQFAPDSRVLVTAALDSTVRFWSVPDGRQLRTLRFSGMTWPFLRGADTRLFTCEACAGAHLEWKLWPLDQGDGVLLGRTTQVISVEDLGELDVDPSGTWAAVPDGHRVLLYDLHDLERGPIRAFGPHPDPVVGARFSPDGDLLVTYDSHCDTRLWSGAAQTGQPVRVLWASGEPMPRAGRSPGRACFDRSGSRLAIGGVGMRVWDLSSPFSKPLVLNEGVWVFEGAFDTRGTWLVTSGTGGHARAWPMVFPSPGVGWGDASDPACPVGLPALPITLEGATGSRVAFTPDGNWLITASTGIIQAWPLDLPLSGPGPLIGAPRALFEAKDFEFSDLKTDDRSQYVFAAVQNSVAGNGTLVMISLADGRVRSRRDTSGWIQVDEIGRWVASVPQQALGTAVRLWDTVTSQRCDFGRKEETLIGFARDGRILTQLGDSLFAWDLRSLGDPSPAHLVDAADTWSPGLPVRHLLETGLQANLSLCPDRETLFLWGQDGSLAFRSIDGTALREVPARIPVSGTSAIAVAHGESLIVVGRDNGDVWVARSTDSRIHRVPVNDGAMWGVAIDPQGRWIASSGDDGVRLWRIPVGAPAQDVPREEFLRRLESLCNLYAKKNEQSASGYTIENRGIPNWRNPPKW